MKISHKILSLTVGATCAATISFSGFALDNAQGSNAKVINSDTTTQACSTSGTAAAKSGVYTPQLGGCGKYPDPEVITTKKLCFAGLCIKSGIKASN